MNITVFPTINNELAFYTPSNFKITLCEISESEFLQLNDDLNDLTSGKKKSIIYHESRHYVDHISTLWGQKYILEYAQAIDVRLNLDYLNFKKLVTYSIHSKRLFYKDYYSEVYSDSKFTLNDKPWLSKAVIGHKFDNEGNSDSSSPVIMFRFSKNDGTGREIARVPLSIVSLLETNSTFEEIRIRAISIANQNKDVKTVEHFTFNKELICDLIYNQNLAVYNVAVHLTANILMITDVAKAIEISSVFATVALNMPFKSIEKMYINPANFVSWTKEIPHLIKNFDYGFIFMNLLYNYKQKFDGNNVDIEEILKTSNLGNYEEFFSAIKVESNNLLQSLQKQENFKSILIDEFIKGQRLLNRLGVGFEKESIAKALYELKIIPHYEFSDTPLNLQGYDSKFLYNSIPHITEDFELWSEFSAIIEDEINNFFQIRGI